MATALSMNMFRSLKLIVNIKKLGENMNKILAKIAHFTDVADDWARLFVWFVFYVALMEFCSLYIYDINYAAYSNELHIAAVQKDRIFYMLCLLSVFWLLKSKYKFFAYAEKIGWVVLFIMMYFCIHNIPSVN